jgi:PAS domain S-box-containing protein
MEKPLKVLIVEDSEDDALLMIHELKRGGYLPAYERVDTCDRMMSALDDEEYSLIIADYTMPEFSGIEALDLYKKRRLDIPFILVSGTIGDDVGVEAMIAGAHDYICKGNLSRLVPAVKREIRESKIRLASRSADDALRKAHDELEKRVQERTAELAEANRALRAEIQERERVERALRSSKEELSIRNRISDIFLSVPDATLYGKVLDVILEAVNSRSGIFGYIDQGGNLVCASLYGNAWQECQMSNKDVVFPSDTWRDNVWGKALREKKSYCVNRSFSVPEGHIPIMRVLTVPIIYQETSIGLITAANKSTDYDDADRELLETTARKIAPILHAKLQHDIQEERRVHAQEALKESEEKYRSVVEQSLVGVYLVQNDILTYVNRKFCEIYSYEYDEIVDKLTPYDLIHPDDRSIIKENIGHRIKDGKGSSEFEFRGVDKNGKIIALKGLGRASLFHGQPAIMGTLIDITKEKVLEQELLHAQKMEAIGTLAGGIAHDFNNILMALMGYANLIQTMMEKDDPLRVYVDPIISCIGKATSLTQSLLVFSRKQVMELKPQQVNPLIKNMEKLLRRLLPEDIEFDMALGEDTTILADTTQIDQVLINLVTNARDAMPKGGALRIEMGKATIDEEFKLLHGYGRPGSYALITVSDTGMGMDQATCEKIFEPFFTTKEVGKGTGLGLSIVYGIVKQHDGYIGVSSQPGVGTTFSIYLPLTKREVSESTRISTVFSGGTETVLLAEDDGDIRRVIKEILEVSGHTVIEAVDGEDAVRKFHESRERIDIALFDVVMPKKNGRDALEEIRKEKHDLPGIFMSGYAGDVILDKGIDRSGFDYVAKPVDPGVLLQKIRKALSK